MTNFWMAAGSWRAIIASSTKQLAAPRLKVCDGWLSTGLDRARLAQADADQVVGGPVAAGLQGLRQGGGGELLEGLPFGGGGDLDREMDVIGEPDDAAGAG